MAHATLIRHTPICDWYRTKKRIGGRGTLGLDLLINGQSIRVYNSHLENRDFIGTGRAKQGMEIILDADKKEHPFMQILGGDLNTFLCNPLLFKCNQKPWAEEVVEILLDAGWEDMLPQGISEMIKKQRLFGYSSRRYNKKR